MDNATSLTDELARADNFKNAGRLAEAADIFRQICSERPDNFEAHLQLGLISWDLQQPDAAIEYLQRAAEMDPASPAPHNGLSEIHFAYGRLDDAEAALHTSLAVSPGQSDAYVKMAFVSLQRQDKAAAAAHCRRGLENDPHLLGAHQLLGVFAWEDGRLEDTVTHMAEARSSRPPGADPNNLLAKSLLALGRGAELETLGPSATEQELFAERVLQALFGWQTGRLEYCRQVITRALELQTAIEDTPAKRFYSIYLRYVASLLDYGAANPEIYQEDGVEDAELYAVGDSQCLATAHLLVGLGDIACRIRPVLVLGAKAANVAGAGANPYNGAFHAALGRIPKGSHVMFCFGEADCRYREGLFPMIRDTPGLDMNETVDGLVNSYVDRMLHAAAERGLKPLFQSPPLVNIDTKHVASDERDLFAQVINRFNQSLRRKVADVGCGLVDLQAVTCGPDGLARGQYYIDANHVLPNAVLEAFEQLVMPRLQ